MTARLALIGPPTAGKTIVGRLVAERLGLKFVDVDAVIEASMGQTVAQIFAQHGEPAFRALEAVATANALAGRDSVVALGGGAVTSPEVRERLAGQPVVWLDVSLEEAVRRTNDQQQQTRPLLAGGDVQSKLAAMLAHRRGLYADACVWRVDTTGKTSQQVADDVMACLKGSCVIRVATQQPYDVIVEQGALRRLAPLVAGVAQVGLIMSPALAHVGAIVQAEVEAAGARALLVQVPVSEAAKTPETLAACWRTLAARDFTRSDLIVGIGGGATTDLAGMVAATYLRGVSWVAAPTSVLGMVDAAVGGKTGIDLPEGKNLVGAFHEPVAVLAGLDTLATLPAAEVRSGLAEAAKEGFTDDPAILELIESDPAAAMDVAGERLAQLIEHAVRVKADVVADDFRERTSETTVGRERLNYGHTLAHAIEAAERFAWRHGEAVAVGSVFAAEVAHRVLGLSRAEVARHRAVFEALGLPISYNGASWQQMRALMARDKKARGAHLRMVLLRGIGDVVVVADPPEDALEDAYLAISQ